MVADRLRCHQRDKDFWDRVVVITSKDANLAKTVNAIRVPTAPLRPVIGELAVDRRGDRPGAVLQRPAGMGFRARHVRGLGEPRVGLRALLFRLWRLSWAIGQLWVGGITLETTQAAASGYQPLIRRVEAREVVFEEVHEASWARPRW